MLSIHGKVLGLAMVMAAIGTGCAVDAADAELDMEGLDEVEAIDEAAAALEEGEEERGGYQAPGKDLLGPQAPVGQLGPAQVGQVGQAPVGQLGPAPIGQAPIGQAPIGQGPIGQGPIGQGPVGAPVGVPGGVGVPGLGGFGVPGLGGFGFPVGFSESRFVGGCSFSPVTINNNNNINIIAVLDRFRNPHHFCPPFHHGPLVRYPAWPTPPVPAFGPSTFAPGLSLPAFGPLGPAAAPCSGGIPVNRPLGWGTC
ncbi:hypothetical protein [Sorangium sp. So ce1024]|uniref:hypothetical protein n=1 Tax=Sorangium sp. So ce1024 TaxID=3133327 RepID=UPI003F009529